MYLFLHEEVSSCCLLCFVCLLWHSRITMLPKKTHWNMEINANCHEAQNLSTLICKTQWTIKCTTCSLLRLLHSVQVRRYYSLNKWKLYISTNRHTHIYNYFNGSTWKQHIKHFLRHLSFVIQNSFPTCEKYASSIEHTTQEQAIIHLPQPDVQGEQYFVLFYPDPFHLPGFHWCPAKDPKMNTFASLLFNPQRTGRTVATEFSGNSPTVTTLTLWNFIISYICSWEVTDLNCISFTPQSDFSPRPLCTSWSHSDLGTLTRTRLPAVYQLTQAWNSMQFQAAKVSSMCDLSDKQLYKPHKEYWTQCLIQSCYVLNNQKHWYVAYLVFSFLPNTLKINYK